MKSYKNIEYTGTNRLIISTVLMLPATIKKNHKKRKKINKKIPTHRLPENILSHMKYSLQPLIDKPTNQPTRHPTSHSKSK